MNNFITEIWYKDKMIHGYNNLIDYELNEIMHLEKENKNVVIVAIETIFPELKRIVNVRDICR